MLLLVIRIQVVRTSIRCAVLCQTSLSQGRVYIINSIEKHRWFYVPEGRTTAARRFIAGLATNLSGVPEGRLTADRVTISKLEKFAEDRSSLRDETE